MTTFSAPGRCAGTLNDLRWDVGRWADSRISGATLRAGTFRGGDWIVLVAQPLGHYGTMSFANAA